MSNKDSEQEGSTNARILNEMGKKCMDSEQEVSANVRFLSELDQEKARFGARGIVKSEGSARIEKNQQSVREGSTEVRILSEMGEQN